MPESFFHLSAKEQEEALQVAASASGRPAHLLEKEHLGRLGALDVVYVSAWLHLVSRAAPLSQKHTKRYAGFQRMWTLLTTSGRSRHNLSGTLLTASTRFLRAGARRRSGPMKSARELLPAWLRNSAHSNRASRTSRTSGSHKPRHGWVHIH